MRTHAKFEVIAKLILCTREHRRFAAMFVEQAELSGTPMGPNGPPNAKATAKIAPEITIGGFGDFLGKTTSNFGHFWPAIFELLGRTASKKAHSVGVLRPTRPSYVRVWRGLNPPEAIKKNPVAGLFTGARSRVAWW